MWCVTNQRWWISSDWTIDTGSLPSGLSLDFLTGEISGTPDTVTPNAPVTINATNAGGYGKVNNFNQVVDEAPSITYPDAPFTFIKNTQVTGVLPTHVGGLSSHWTIGSLPSGLSVPSGLIFRRVFWHT